MRIPSFVYAAACLSISILPTVTAFYPITPDYGRGDSTKSQRRDPRTFASNALTTNNRKRITLPLRKVPLRRDNIYNILNSNNPTQENSVAIDQDGTDMSYMVAVKFGESQEEYHLLLDSAASNTWVMSESCMTEACKTHNLFGNGDSSSLKTEDTKFSITYGTGSVSGTIGTDTIHISTMSPTLTFGLATNVSSEFSSYPMDGILGIGRGDNTDGTIESPTIMDVLSTSGSIKSKLYAIHLSRSKDGLNDGELNLGEINKDRFNGELNYVPTIPNDTGFWEVGIDDIGVDGTMTGINDRTAILDSGTSFILMPEGDAVSVHELIPGYTQSGETFTVPCSTTKVVQIAFGGQRYNISTADYIGGELGNGKCKSNIIGRQTFGEKEWLVGDVFLKNVYSVFDFDNSQVGFGVKGSGKQQSASSISSSASATATPIGEQSSPIPTFVPTSAGEAASNSLPIGGSPTANPTSPSPAPANPTAQAQQPGRPQQSQEGGVGRTSSPFAFTLALGLMAVFV
ncbi:acid protease [Lojkania enalia]|uniref:Acid protease n=1 Tax=Lojkania enalia TaxID=147567 RepID=A0A9P4K3J8_9PLEO|nr:acid protease [Didymosphaeria enalia]